jgi:two-component system chemotaxis sensor kinase CheA
LSEKTSPTLSAELLDDFFGEADEHLVSIRQAVGQLEHSVDKAQADPAVVEELFRSFHSLKGISAIVGLAPAEAVAHASEDYLRLMRGGTIPLTGRGLETLMAAARKLEQIVGAFRLHKPVPGCDSLLNDLKKQCESGVSSSTPKPQTHRAETAEADVAASIEGARARGLVLCNYTFIPSQELSSQGVNIGTIREQLSKNGEILKATSSVKGQGVIAFEFLVAARETAADLAGWEAKGVTVQIVEQEAHALRPSSSIENAANEEISHSPFLAPSHVVRVDMKRLDELMRITGEMVIHRSRLDAELAKVNQKAARVNLQGVQEVSNNLGRTLRDLRKAIMGVRLVPVAEIFARMPFVVRDLTRDGGKKVRLTLHGQETAIDKYLIERLKDPLLHLVRNALSHGLETPEERAAASKPEEATIELRAFTVADTVVIQVRDDGKGVNRNNILRQAEKLGFPIPSVIDNSTILNLLCTPGFSTRDDADRSAGRGVGMAVVQSTLRELGGTLSMESEEGHGTQFTLSLPLTLAIAETLIVRAAGQTCALPQSFVREIMHTTEEQIRLVNGVEAIPYRSGVLPIIRLAGLFGLKGLTRPAMYILVVTSDRGSIGLLTEEVVGQREVVVRPLKDPLIQVAGITGATELGDGKPVLILDGAALTNGKVRPTERALALEMQTS